jgi:hypothetical protein
MDRGLEFGEPEIRKRRRAGKYQHSEQPPAARQGREMIPDPPGPDQRAGYLLRGPGSPGVYTGYGN